MADTLTLVTGVKMLGTRRFILVMLLMFSATSYLCADTWQISTDSEWESIAESENGKYLLTANKIKSYAEEGDSKSLKKVAAELREDYPEVAGEDFDKYIEIELLYAKSKWGKAADKVKLFLEEYPESLFYEPVIERYFSIGVAFLNGQRKTVVGIFRVRAYDDGEYIMDAIVEKSGESPLAKRTLETLARSFEDRELYPDAYDRWSEMSARWPTGDTGEEALLGMARSMHMDYGGPKYDAKSLQSAKTYYGAYDSRYPELAENIQVPQRLEQIVEQLAYKEYRIGQYYQKTKAYGAAILYYEYVIRNWPETKAAVMSAERVDEVKKIQAAPEKKKTFIDKINFFAWEKS